MYFSVLIKTGNLEYFVGYHLNTSPKPSSNVMKFTKTLKNM